MDIIEKSTCQRTSAFFWCTCRDLPACGRSGGAARLLLRYPKQPSGLRLYHTKQPFCGDPGRFDSVADNAATWLPLTAATRSGRFICHWQRSHRSPPSSPLNRKRKTESQSFPFWHKLHQHCGIWRHQRLAG